MPMWGLMQFGPHQGIQIDKILIETMLQNVQEHVENTGTGKKYGCNSPNEIGVNACKGRHM